MTKSKLKIAISGLIASAIMLALLLVPGIKSPASAETLTNNGNETIFARPDDVTTDFAKHTFGDGETKNAMCIKFGNLTIDDETWSPYVNVTFAALTLKIEWAGAENEYPRTDGKVQYFTFEGTWNEFAAAPGFANSDDENTTNNAKYLDLVSETSGYTLYFVPGTDIFQLFASSYASGSDSNNLFYHVDTTEDWYLTLTVTYNNDGWVYTDDTPTAPTVTFTRIKFNPTSKTAAFELSDIDKAYQAGYQAGLAAGGSGSGHTDEELAAARQEGYNSGKQDGYNSGKQEGYESGYGSGKADGFEDGLESGKKLGYTNGFTDGNKPGSEIFIENGVKTKFARPDNLSACCVLHTFGDGEKRAMRINFGNITLNGKVWSPYLSGAFSALSLKITNPSSGTFSTISWCDLSSGLGLGYDENKNTIDLTCDSNGVWSFYFAVPMRGETVNLVANGKTYSISNKTSNKDWTFTLTVAYAADDSNTGEALPDVEYTSVNYNPDTYACAFVPTAAEEAYNDGHESGYSDGYSEGSLAGYDTGKTAGITEGKKTGYDEGYAAGLAAAKNNPGTEDKTDGKPGDTIIPDKPVSWLKKNKTTLIVGSLLVVGLVVLLCILNRAPRRRR